MYSSLIFFHSIFRWLVLVSLIVAILTAFKGYSLGSIFTKRHDSIRHWTATISHIQLMIGSVLYFTSPFIKYILANFKQASQQREMLFFGVIHISLMFVSILVITIGSALSKRQPADRKKFKTMLVWFSAAFFVILIAIPWPFSPFANRPYFRPF